MGSPPQVRERHYTRTSAMPAARAARRGSRATSSSGTRRSWASARRCSSRGDRARVPRPRRRRARATSRNRAGRRPPDWRAGSCTRPGARGAPPMDAMTYVSPPSKNGTTGTVRAWPDLFPVVVSKRIFLPAHGAAAAPAGRLVEPDVTFDEELEEGVHGAHPRSAARRRQEAKQTGTRSALSVPMGQTRCGWHTGTRAGADIARPARVVTA